MVCQHQGGDWRAENIDFIAVFWFYFLSNPWLWQLLSGPRAVGLSCSVTAGPSTQSRALPWGPSTSSSSSSSCPRFGFPKHDTVPWLSAHDLLSGSVWEVTEFFWDCCGWFAAISYYIFHLGSLGSVFGSYGFGAFPCPVVQGVFGLVFFHSDSGKMF